MMVLVVCDKCRIKMGRDDWQPVRFPYIKIEKVYDMATTMTYNLCHDCQEKFEKWLEERGTDTEQLLAINKAEVADKIQDLYLDNYPNPSADLEKFFHEVLRIVVNAKPLEVSNNVCND